MGNPLRGIKDKMPLWLGEPLSCHVFKAERCSRDASVLVIGGGRGRGQPRTAPYAALRWQTTSPSQHSDVNTFCITPRVIPKWQQPGVFTAQPWVMLKIKVHKRTTQHHY